jgi:hypothetical protein
MRLEDRITPVNIQNTLVNIPAEDPGTSDTQNETSTIVFGNNVVSAYNDSAFATSHYTGWSHSTDGGATFTDQGILPGTNDAGDPVLAYDKTNNRVYLTTLSTSGSTLNFFRSTDAGATFSTPIDPFNNMGGANWDKDWVTVDNFAGTGQSYIYEVARNFGTGGGIWITRSTNLGVSFSNISQVVTTATNQGANVSIGPDHSVYVFWLDGTSGNKIQMRRSTNLGVSFGPTVTVATLNNTSATNGDLGLEFRSNSFPQSAVNPVTGEVYVVYNDKSGTDRGNAYFSRSTNNGTTWSTPVKVNDDTGTHDQYMPSIAVTPDGTKLVVSFYDRRLDPANSLIDYYAAPADIGTNSVTFRANVRVSTQSFPAVFGVDANINSTYMGDYDVVSADNSNFYCVWGDNRLPSLVRTGNNNDVRLAKFSVNAAGPEVVTYTPKGVQTAAVSTVNVTFNQSMDTTSFALTDITSFQGPGGTDLTGAITGFSWPNNRQLQVTFAPQSGAGIYAMAIGSNIKSAGGILMDDNLNGTPGEAADGVTVSFVFATPSYVVNQPLDENDGNYGPGDLSLREAIALCNATAGAHTITFDPTVFANPTTISMIPDGQMSISKALTIVGPAARLTINANKYGRVFNISGGAVSISGLTIINGTTFGTGGGINATSALTLDGLQISGCSAANGGAVSDAASPITILNSTLSGSVASASGGGLYTSGNATVVIRNSTISGNSAKTSGGGISLATWSASGSFTVSNTTITANTAGSAGGGGGVRTSGGGATLNFESTIIAGNSTSSSASPDFQATNVKADTSVIGVANSGITSLTGTGSQTGTVATPLNPQLGPLADNGGPTFTNLPSVSSPAFTKGSNSAGLVYDQRGPGYLRNVGGAVDVGAVQVLHVIPGATMTALGPITVASATPNTVVVTYTDDQGIQVATIKTSNITITGPGGSLPITNVSVDVNSDGTPRVATYTFNPPAGLWTNAANGSYSVSMNANEVADIDATTHYVPAGSIGTFQVNVALPSAKLNSLGPIIVPGPTPNSLTVTFSTSASLINVSTIAPTNIAITDPSNNPLTITGATVDVNSDGTPRTATYTFTPPGGAWNASVDGTYSVAMIANQVSDEASQFVAGGSLGSFQVNIPFPSAKFNGLGPITLSGPTPNSLTVTFSTPASLIKVSTIAPTNITITDPSNNPLTITGATVDVNSDGTPRTATYTFVPPGGAWNATLNGVYSVAMIANQVSDVVSEFVPGGSLGTFQVAIPRTLVVNATTDTGTGSGDSGDLRYCISQTNADITNTTDQIIFDPVIFASAQKIALNLGQISITNAVSIIGPAAKVTIDAGKSSRVFNIDVPSKSGQPVSISGMTLINGSPASGNGGAIFDNDEALSLSNVAITGCQTPGNGGAIALTLGAGSLNLTDCTLTGNAAVGTNSGGGAIAVAAGASMTLTRCSLSGNTAGRAGGGVYLRNLTTLTMTDSTLSGNTANALSTSLGGGGVYLYLVTATIRNCTISGNNAAAGGAIRSAGSTMTIQSSTVAFNSASSFCGGIYRASGGTLSITSTIVADNLAPTNPDISSSLTSASFSLVGNTFGTTISGSNNQLNVDPLLGPLQNNGGPTLTHILLPGSPAIDTGTNIAGLSYDQRGVGHPRTAGSGTDIGALELPVTPPKIAVLVINGGQVQRSRVTSVTVTFDQVVTLPATPTQAFQLQRSDGQLVDLTAAVSFNTVTLSFNGALSESGSLADGRYTLTIFAAQVSNANGKLDGNGDGTGGDDYVLASAAAPNPPTNIFRLFGDINGDGTVSAADFTVFRQFFAGVNDAFDFDGNGTVDANDFVQFRLRFGGSI